MYENKSPMNVNFLIYGLLVLTILSVVFHYIHIRPNKLFNVWNKNGYTMYLYQNVVYSFTLYIIILPFELQRNSMIGFVACSFAIFIMSVFFNSTLYLHILSRGKQSFHRKNQLFLQRNSKFLYRNPFFPPGAFLESLS